MSFIADKQTLDDLNLLGKYKSGSIFHLFNRVQTDGGEKLLELMFRHPLQDPEAINQRSRLLQHFQQKTVAFSMNPSRVKDMELYLGAPGNGNGLSTTRITLQTKLLQLMGVKERYELLVTGLEATKEVLKSFAAVLTTIAALDPQHPFLELVSDNRQLLEDKQLSLFLLSGPVQQLNVLKLARFDHCLRTTLYERLKGILQTIYQLDVLLAVAAVGRGKGFSYAQALPAGDNTIRISGLYHPGITGAVTNPVSLHGNSNVIFLTGANMAGKSTFMKSFGIAVYLAHMGFPLAVENMAFSIRDGLFSSINVPDNLKLGYSHFYAEVLRVKQVAEAVSEGKNLVVIFDELFKGTNVKDAYDATLAVSEAFGENNNCFFIISTHIMEVGEQLMGRCKHFQFLYLPTILKGSIPAYTYKLQEGISADRHGMMIIENEGILEIIRGEAFVKQ